MAKRLLWVFTLGSAVGVLGTVLHPVSSSFLRLAFLCCLVGVWSGSAILLWNRRPLQLALLALPLLPLVFLSLPGRKFNEEDLQMAYLRRLAEFDGTKYYWGGENARGIDCSGLPRRALRDSLLGYGLRTLNGRALRAYVEHWWFDASAQALGQGYRGYTSRLGTRGTIRKMSYDELVPGDLAVTESGNHILVYVGDGQWTQADPGAGAVVTLDGRKSQNTWFDQPVTTHRWSFLRQP